MRCPSCGRSVNEVNHGFWHCIYCNTSGRYNTFWHDIDVYNAMRRGYWKENKTLGAVGYTCSCCGETIYCCAVNGIEELPRFCSKCGAKMDAKCCYSEESDDRKGIYGNWEWREG